MPSPVKVPFQVEEQGAAFNATGSNPSVCCAEALGPQCALAARLFSGAVKGTAYGRNLLPVIHTSPNSLSNGATARCSLSARGPCIALSSSLAVMTTAWSLITSLVALSTTATPNVSSTGEDAFWHSR